MPADITTTVVELDFSGAPPAQGGGESDHIPEDLYDIRVDDIENGKSKNDKPMITVRFKVADGPFANKRLVERFTIPRPGTDDSLFGLQRFHALLIALGFSEQSKRVKVDLKKLVNRVCTAEVGDETQAATEQYPERTRSRPFAFHPLGSQNGAGPAAVAQAAEEEDEEDEVEEAPPPKPKAKKKAPAPPVEDDEDEDEVEDPTTELDDLI